MRFKSALLCGAAVAALAFAHAAPASAAVGANPVYGAGGSAEAYVYRSLFNCVGENGTPSGLNGVLGLQSCLPSSPAVVPLAGNMEILYAAVGTDSGQNDYLTHRSDFGATPSNTTGFLPDEFLVGSYQDTAAGYSYPYGGGTVLHFGAGSAPLTANQLVQTSISGHPVVVGMGNVTGPAIQVPTLITAVLVPFHASTLDGLAGLPIPTDGQGFNFGTSGLVLSTEQLCGIFNGDIKDWSDPTLTQSNGLTPSSTSKPIIVAYRHDSAGTTFLMSNALITQCAGTSHPMNPAWGPASTSYFGNAAPKPATWKDENTDLDQSNGDKGIADAVNGTDGAISYISPLFFPQPNEGQPYLSPPTANLVNRAGTVVPPTLYSISLIMADKAPPTSADDAVTWGTKGLNPNPSNQFAYPIGGFSWVYLYTCYANVQDFIDIASGSQPGTWGWYFGSFAGVSDQLDIAGMVENGGLFTRIPNDWLRAVRNLLFSNPATKIRVGPSPGVCTGGA